MRPHQPFSLVWEVDCQPFELELHRAPRPGPRGPRRVAARPATGLKAITRRDRGAAWGVTLEVVRKRESWELSQTLRNGGRCRALKVPTPGGDLTFCSTLTQPR